MPKKRIKRLPTDEPPGVARFGCSGSTSSGSGRFGNRSVIRLKSGSSPATIPEIGDAQHKRYDNSQQRIENQKLVADNMQLKEALANATCLKCGGPPEMSFEEQQLRIENAFLREEIDKVSGIIAKHVGKPTHTHPDRLGSSFNPQQGVLGANDILRSMAVPTEKRVIVELASVAMKELIEVTQVGEPLWVPISDDSSQVTLNEDEYLRSFPRCIGPKPMGMKSEGSRESTVIFMNHIAVVEMLMDVNQWSTAFGGIVSRAMTLEILSTGVANNYNGVMQVMTAEYQVPSPLVPTRENYFVRYCKRLEDGTWVVVDVSLDNLSSSAVVRCRRRPSGCLIQELPNGYSKVTWVENVVVVNGAVPDIYQRLVSTAFGAKRWVETLKRQCERLAGAMASNNPSGDVRVINPEGRKSMLKLAQRMVFSFCSGVGASTAHTWTTLSGRGWGLDDVRVMTRINADDTGRPVGILLGAATSFWLPNPPKQVFSFLRDENSRSKWDTHSNCELVREMVHIANGRDPGNCVSLLRVNSANPSQSNMLMLQESSTDSTGSYVIYAPVDIAMMNVVLNDGDPDYVPLLPSGFAILPDGLGQYEGEVLKIGTSGSFITIGLQILFSSVPTAKISLESVATVNNLVKCTVERISCAINSYNQ
ncbi:homeobox-leucine zipper protein MERISTEM L1-like [Bidens hawaiensis]|uniref:homeobox-leucine zipper protein MERISTEM L1-like n=1 Tax=Bidens hawaiensis TaxID=980011 RepID=UPI004048FB68